MLKSFSFFYLTFILLLVFFNNQVEAYCNENNYFGISSGSPIMSTVDVTASPLYSTTSTSGTSGCKNWDFAKYLEESRKKFVSRQHQQILEETAQGGGPHLKALGKLMGCTGTHNHQFGILMKRHHAKITRHLTRFDHRKTLLVLKDLKHWIAQDLELSKSCINLV
ncbi:MAG: DUF3015 family protein [SAR324 cluster bacterium]|nr:DUF3015 family protein [SAR324 cluster bacterium]